MWETLPGPSRSASVIVSPGIGRLLSSFEAGSGLLEDERRATNACGRSSPKGSGIPGSWARPSDPGMAPDAAHTKTIVDSTRVDRTTVDRTTVDRTTVDSTPLLMSPPSAREPHHSGAGQEIEVLGDLGQRHRLVSSGDHVADLGDRPFAVD